MRTNTLKVSCCLTHSDQQCAVRNSSAANSVHVPHQQTPTHNGNSECEDSVYRTGKYWKEKLQFCRLIAAFRKILIGNIYLFIYLNVTFCSH